MYMYYDVIKCFIISDQVEVMLCCLLLNQPVFCHVRPDVARLAWCSLLLHVAEMCCHCHVINLSSFTFIFLFCWDSMIFITADVSLSLAVSDVIVYLMCCRSHWRSYWCQALMKFWMQHLTVVWYLQSALLLMSFPANSDVIWFTVFRCFIQQVICVMCNLLYICMKNICHERRLLALLGQVIWMDHWSLWQIPQQSL